jgi:alpha-tubulin suppressor-like RCC1 family protein
LGDGTTAFGASEYHSLALKSDGSVWAWGRNDRGQLGNGTTNNNANTTPMQVKGPGGIGFLSGVTAIRAGYLHSLALKDDGTVWAWGWNAVSQLGDGTTTDRTTPVQVKGPGGIGFLSGVTAITAGYHHNLAIKSDGTLWAWGHNIVGQLGDGSITDRATPVQLSGLSGVTAIGAGGHSSLAVLSDGTVRAWGHNGHGELGDGTNTDRTTPVQVKGPGGIGFLSGVTAITAGEHHSLALKSDGTVWAWGFNFFGELGDGSTTNNATPVQVKGPGGIGFLSGVIAIATNGHHSLAILSGGTVRAWGHNGYGQLGDGTTTERTTPVQVKGPGGIGFLSNVTAIEGGSFHSFAVISVGPADTTTTIISDSPDPSVVGQAYTVQWTVAVVAPGSGTPTGTVTVSGGSGCSAAVAAGQCDVTSTSVGAKTLIATYSGDSNFNGSVSAAEAHTVVDATPPVVTAPEPLTVECNTTGGVLSSEPAIQAWLASASANDDTDGPVAVTNDLAAGLCAVGTTKTVTFSASDAAGNPGTDTSTISVVDTTGPTIGSVSASPNFLWPPNHNMVPVTVTVSVADACDPSVTCSITTVTSNEPENGLGDGDTSPDWAITGDLTLDLRAERSGKGTERVYTITVTCTDDSGNSATKTVTVAAPHSKGK